MFVENRGKKPRTQRFASALMDNDKEKIKKCLVNLGQEARAWNVRAHSFWTKKNPTDELVRQIAALSPKWKDRIKMAFDLPEAISEETLHHLLRKDAAPKKSPPSNDGEHRPS